MITLYKNGKEIERGNAFDLMRPFFDPNELQGVYLSMRYDLEQEGRFEFVVDNDVYFMRED